MSTYLEFVETKTDGTHIMEVNDFIVRFAGVIWN